MGEYLKDLTSIKSFADDLVFLSKHLSWCRCLKNILRTSFVLIFKRRPQDVLLKMNKFSLAMHLQKMSSRRTEDILIKINVFALVTHLPDVIKTSLRHFEQVLSLSSRRTTEDKLVLSTRLQNIFKTSSRCFQGALKTFSRRISREKLVFLTQQVFKTYCKEECLQKKFTLATGPEELMIMKFSTSEPFNIRKLSERLFFRTLYIMPAFTN